LAKLALFDFDGTITDSDSLIGFIRFVVGDIKFLRGLVSLSPMLIKYKLGFISNDKAKEHMLTYFFRGIDTKTFNQYAKEFSLTYIDKILRTEAMDKITWHQSLGHDIVIVSASMRCWLHPWCDRHKMQLISTELEVVDNKITGKFGTKNCYGVEKERRVKALYDLESYEYIYAYGDSKGDKELLSLGDESHYKPFRE